MKAILKLEMPEDCWGCPFSDNHMINCRAIDPTERSGMCLTEGRPTWCPLIPIPEFDCNNYAIYEIVDIETNKVTFTGNKYECGEYLGCKGTTIQNLYSNDNIFRKRYAVRRAN